MKESHFPAGSKYQGSEKERKKKERKERKINSLYKMEIRRMRDEERTWKHT